MKVYYRYNIGERVWRGEIYGYIQSIKIDGVRENQYLLENGIWYWESELTTVPALGRPTLADIAERISLLEGF